jgi:hypothetical protein
MRQISPCQRDGSIEIPNFCVKDASLVAPIADVYMKAGSKNGVLTITLAHNGRFGAHRRPVMRSVVDFAPAAVARIASMCED